MTNKKKTVKRFAITIGLNDSDTFSQKCEIEKAIDIVKNCCKSYRVPCTYALADGGYIHSNGTYINEKSLVISIIDPDDENMIDEISRDLCAFFNQECVSVMCENVEYYFVHDSIKK